MVTKPTDILFWGEFCVNCFSLKSWTVERVVKVRLLTGEGPLIPMHLQDELFDLDLPL